MFFEMNTTDDNLNQLLSNSYILAGSPCSGKSTLAEMLSPRGLAALPDHMVSDLEESSQTAFRATLPRYIVHPLPPFTPPATP
ncbi:MAG: hypothetical protein KatS3mg046_529 [Bellilinea sp.]|nr:MAG: hypothetical protein KatS3mg046_529 [Bellilinea sp.]